MPAIINSVILNSIAKELEINPDDELISIDNIQPRDLIDYKYLVSSEKITLRIKRSTGEEEIFDIEKDFDEDLGINFESAVFNKIFPCNNKCIFCFVDQQPTKLRNSLYIKDDDYRLSYLQGTYITLTNLNKEQKARIEALRLGPLYISVHTTNPELRSYMLGNPNAKNIANKLKWLNNLDIPIHTQIVLCPGINDKKELDKTLNDLAKLKSNILSIAVVPVGITKYRKDKNFSKVDILMAQEVISQINKFNNKLGYNLAFPSDEFYIKARYDFPNSKFYQNFDQLDDGVGACRLLLDDFEKNKIKLPGSLPKPKELTIATGQIAIKTLNPIVNYLNNKIENLKIDLVSIKSDFWGEDVTVSGLITGQDLLDNLLPIKSKMMNLLIPSVMLKKLSHEFLDGLTLNDIQKNLEIPIYIIENYYSTDELITMIF
ncbi:MAG: DUF512 domain-containing protein [bacterium]